LALAQDFVEVDSSQHDLKTFDCGKPVMNQFLAKYATQNMRAGVSRTWVLTDPAANDPPSKAKIAAYFTLASNMVKREEIPTEKTLPSYPLPVVLLARLAVDQQYQGQGLGEKTLITALRKSVELTSSGLPAIGLILDVLDEDALSFYDKYKMFSPFTDDPMRLYVPMSAIKNV